MAQGGLSGMGLIFKQADRGLQCAERTGSPVILGVTESACKYMAGIKTVAAMTRAMYDDLGITIPAVLQLDHATLDGAYSAIESGFNSVMYDGSHEPFETNLMNTTELVRFAHSRGVTVEAELGAPSGFEEGVISGNGALASIEECRTLAAAGIDMLAACIGNFHGEYPVDWQGLSFDHLLAIRKATGKLPLVLHGGSGVPPEMLRRAIDNGVAKINVNTECQAAYAYGIRRYIEEKRDLLPGGNRFTKLSSYGCAALNRTVVEKITLFGSAAKT